MLNRFKRTWINDLKSKATKGNVEAQLTLSRLYRYGMYVSINEREAERWFKLAEEGRKK